MRNSRIEKRYMPPEAKALGAEHVFVYTGQSMSPTFRPGQLLYVRPAAQELAPGDVVVYRDPEQQEGYVVHRVVGRSRESLMTRGDANARRDRLPVAYGQVVGQVIQAELSGQVKAVRGGRGGLWAARARWAMLRLWNRAARYLAVPYRVVRTSPTVRRVLKGIWRPRLVVIHLQTPQGEGVKVVHRGRVVARSAASGERLVWRKPYDLLHEGGDLLVEKRETKPPSE